MRVAEEDKKIDKIVEKLRITLTEPEIEMTVPLIKEIQRLKKEKNAVVLGHNYMSPEVFHGVSDFVGDSLGLSYAARDANADIILFNGVHFMAETAKIMSPNTKVLIADLKAGCSLAESITGEDVRALKAKHPGVPVVTYVNCSAAVKAETDVCCTSANALKVVESIDSDEILFLPDEYLTGNIQKMTSKKLISWPGRCIVHEMYTPEDLENTRRHFTDLTVITHPECNPEVVDRADFNGSTSQMIDFIRQSNSDNILLLTECSMGDNVRQAFPEKKFVSTCQTCPHMKKITLEKVRTALLEEKFEIHLDEKIIQRARKAVEAMLDIGR